MASAVLVGANPMYGLYASVAGSIGDGLAVSTRLTVLTTTTAAAHCGVGPPTVQLPGRRPSRGVVLAVGAGQRDDDRHRPTALGSLHPVCLGVGAHRIPQRPWPDVLEQLRHTHRVDLRDAVTVSPASETIVESTHKACDEPEEWLAVHAS